MEFGELRSTVFLTQAIGMAVKKGNAASVLGSVCKGQHLQMRYTICNVIVFLFYLLF